jgi:hypothetical protein
LFSVNITLPSNATSLSFQSFATNPFGSTTGITNTFSGFNYNSVGTLLAVNFKTFEAKLSFENIVNLTWEVEDEEFHDRYEVERSIDGKNWNSIDVVSDLLARNSKKVYPYEDTKPLLGTIYYRIVHYDLLGEITFSRLRSIENNANQFRISTSPNPSPTSELLTLNLNLVDKGNYQIALFDQFGRKIYETNKTLSQEDHIVLIEYPLSQGIYFVKMSLNDKKIYETLKVIKI